MKVTKTKDNKTIPMYKMELGQYAEIVEGSYIYYGSIVFATMCGVTKLNEPSSGAVWSNVNCNVKYDEEVPLCTLTVKIIDPEDMDLIING